MTDYDSFSDQNTPIVIDNGSGTIKAGTAGENTPSCIIPTLMATPKPRLPPAWKPGRQSYQEDIERFFGDQAQANRAFCQLHYPIKNGVVQNMKTLSQLWQYIYKTQLHVSMSEHPILMTDAPHNPFSNRVHIAEVLLEERSVPALYFAPSAILSLYARGKQTGCVLDCGEGVTSCVPIFEGYILPHTVQRTNIAGECITDELLKLLKLECTQPSVFQCLDRASTKDELKQLKEKKCQFLIPNTQPNKDLLRFDVNKTCVENYIAHYNTDTNTNMNNNNNNNNNNAEQKADYADNGNGNGNGNAEDTYALPDGSVLNIGRCRFRASEVIFNPLIMGSEQKGVAQLLFDCVQGCDLELRRHLYSNIILSGGTTMTRGFGNRLLYELQRKKRKTKLKIIAPNNRDLSPWIGGSLLTSLDTFRPLWITDREYQDQGPNILLRKTMFR